MDTIKCIKTRMSIRKFRPEPVPKEILMEIINIAKWSPSYKNTQPWEVIILSGEKKEELTKLLVEYLEQGETPNPDLPEPQSWPAAQSARIDHLYKMRAEATGIDLNDAKVIRMAKKANFGFYGAPLAAHAKGLGTVPQAFATDYAQEVKKFLAIPETKRLVLGISIGYPEMESPANAFRTDRVATEEIVQWHE